MLIIIPLSHFQRIYRKSHQYKRYRDSGATGNHGLVFRFVLAGPGNAMHVLAKSLESDSRALTTPKHINRISLLASKAPSAGGLDHPAVTARFLTIQRLEILEINAYLKTELVEALQYRDPRERRTTGWFLGCHPLLEMYYLMIYTTRGCPCPPRTGYAPPDGSS